MLDHSVISEGDILLFTGVAAVLLGCCVPLLQAQCRNLPFARLSLYVLAILGLATGGFLLLDLDSLAASLGLLAVLWLLAWVLRQQVSLVCFAVVRRTLGYHAVQAGALLLLGFGSLLSWSAWQTDLMDDGVAQWAPDELPALRPCGFRAITDLGNPVHLCEATQPTPEADSLTWETKFITHSGMSAQWIRTAPPSNESNCHGTVFTAGRYWVFGEEVPGILRDNGYKPVKEPKAGDLVIYFDQISRVVLHTGVVFAITPEGRITVESKWGKGGRFLHLPGSQDYSPTWRYFRSPREGHLLQNLDPQADLTVKKE